MELVITEIEPHMQSEEVQSEEVQSEEREKQEMQEMQSGPEEALNALNTILEATPTFDDFCEPCEKKPQKVVEPQAAMPQAAMPRTRGSSKAALGPSVEVRIKRGDVFSQVRQKNRAVIQPKHEFLGRMMSGRSHRLVGGMPMRMRVGT